MTADHETTTPAAAVDAAIAAIKARAGLVRIKPDGSVTMTTGQGTAPYDFQLSSPGDALRWIEHLADKTWCTKSHLLVFASLAATHFGVRYR